ncbi:hypothetical protein A3F66_00505 [candidate division TM6 bacterium RIFCSPHIGHO2_12_FULL_32_22]|nr:MAG: hypothetical protein A3F66_00505 [candidate division TM6 bacterium RIFCSPHIGHO2_12_FULL_32_22]
MKKLILIIILFSSAIADNYDVLNNFRVYNSSSLQDLTLNYNQVWGWARGMQTSEGDGLKSLSVDKNKSKTISMLQASHANYNNWVNGVSAGTCNNAIPTSNQCDGKSSSCCVGAYVTINDIATYVNYVNYSTSLTGRPLLFLRESTPPNTAIINNFDEPTLASKFVQCSLANPNCTLLNNNLQPISGLQSTPASVAYNGTNKPQDITYQNKWGAGTPAPTPDGSMRLNAFTFSKIPESSTVWVGQIEYDKLALEENYITSIGVTISKSGAALMAAQTLSDKYQCFNGNCIKMKGFLRPSQSGGS